jgi:branched-chain amino acid transport system ATP-binding protein
MSDATAVLDPAATSPTATNALEVRGLSAGYGALAVIHDVSLSVGHGEVVGLLGRNGAGKTTTLMAIAGFLGKYEGEVTVNEEPVRGPAFRRCREQLGIVLEGRSVFPSLTVGQNLNLAQADIDEAIGVFPELKPKLSLRAGLLSGGEQQMLAVARAVCRHPTALMIDELSFGLAPALCERMFERIRAIAAEKNMAVLLVEQNIHYAEIVADRVVIMNEGVIRAGFPAKELSSREAEIERIYLGAGVIAETA